MTRKFSKNGKPLGRTSSRGNQNKSWSKEEDNYLKLAVENKTPRSIVASRLGRSPNAVTLRKNMLNIKGAFGRSKKSDLFKTKILVKNQSFFTKSQDASPLDISDSQIFKLETGIPVPARFSRNEEQRNKIRQLLKEMKHGQSFVVPKHLCHVTKHLIMREFESYKTRVCATNNDKTFYRIFRIA